MSQSTRLYTQMTFFKNYNSKDEVERDLEKAREHLANLKKEQLMFIMMTEPNKFKEDEQTVEYYLKTNADYLFESIQDAAIEEWKLSILLDCWDECHTKDGLGKYPPEAAQHTYIDGTFVFTDKYPTKEALLA